MGSAKAPGRFMQQKQRAWTGGPLSVYVGFNPEEAQKIIFTTKINAQRIPRTKYRFIFQYLSEKSETLLLNLSAQTILRVRRCVFIEYGENNNKIWKS